MVLETIVIRRVKRNDDDDDNEAPSIAEITSTDDPFHGVPVFTKITSAEEPIEEVTETTDSAPSTVLWDPDNPPSIEPMNSEDYLALSSLMATKTRETVITEESTITGDIVTQTDSGQTITIPNNEVVTVTRHTIVVTGKPPPLPIDTTLQTSSISTSSPRHGESTQVLEDEGRDNVGSEGNGPDLSTGALVGIGVGAAIVIALVVLLVFGMKKRRQKSQDNNDAARPSDYDRDQDLEEKHFPEHITPHTTGTQPEDPFAPFGGRVDRPDDAVSVLQTPNNVFEMDATTIAPVELPAISPGANPRPRSATVENRNATPSSEATYRDPRANLNSLGTEGGEPRYVNHWNEYRAMGSA